MALLTAFMLAFSALLFFVIVVRRAVAQSPATTEAIIFLGSLGFTLVSAVNLTLSAMFAFDGYPMAQQAMIAAPIWIIWFYCFGKTSITQIASILLAGGAIWPSLQSDVSSISEFVLSVSVNLLPSLMGAIFGAMAAILVVVLGGWLFAMMLPQTTSGLNAS